MSFTIDVFLGWLMIAGSVLWAYYTYQLHSPSFISRLKSLILLAAGILLLIYPFSGIVTITLVVSLYLLTGFLSR